MLREERNLPEASDEYYRNIFDTYTDGSGFIPLRELRDILMSDGVVPRKIVRKVFNMYESNHDGKIDYHEFIGMIHDKNFKENFVHYVNIYIRLIMPQPYRPILGEGAATKYENTKGLYEEQYSCSPPPIAMLLISAFQIICCLIDEITKQNSKTTGIGVMASIFIYDPYRRFECWRYLTYTFVHIGYPHLLVNLGFQLLVGVPLEMVHKWWRILLVYFAGTVAGSLATSIMDPTTYLAGASGGVYALLVAHVASIIMNWSEMLYPDRQLFIFIMTASRDVGMAIRSRYWLKSNDNICYTAQFTGGIVGLVVGTWTLKNFLPTTKDKYLWWFALVIFIVSMGVMIVLNITWTGHFLPSRVG